MGTLFLVATPIGNLEDITHRALRVLSQVNLIAAEDTRQTAKLLSHFHINTPTTSYFEHSQKAKLDQVLHTLESGDVALVSDAGTPALNDPGFELVRAALDAGYPVQPIPGPSAPIAALVASGLPTSAFVYLGYLPRKSNDRRRLIAQVAQLSYTLIFLETPHRLQTSLSDLLTGLGNRQACVARELTKLHEEIVRGDLNEILLHFQNHAPRGEFTLVLAGAEMAQPRWEEPALISAIHQEVNSGAPASVVAARLAQKSGWPRREIYQLILGQNLPSNGS